MTEYAASSPGRLALPVSTGAAPVPGTEIAPDNPRPDVPGSDAPGSGSAARRRFRIRPTRSGAARTGAAVLSGLALWAAFPSLDWWPLAPVALAGLTLAARGASARRGAALGLVFGLAFFVPHLHWSGVYVGLVPWAALSVLESCYLAVMGALMPFVWRAPGGRAGTVLATAGLWVAQEAMRGRTPFGGFPWARVAFSQADSPLLGFAALGGAPLVTAAVAAVGAVLALLVVDLASRRAGGPARTAGSARTGGRAARTAATAATAVAGLALVAAGAWIPRPTGAASSIRVAAVQGNVPRAGLEFNAQRRAVLDDHVRATVQLGARIAAGTAQQPDVVLWPENSSDIDPFENADAAEVIQQAADAVHVPILIGTVIDGPGRYLSNAGILWGPTGTPQAGPGAEYIKRHPAPFAEYIPDRSFFRHFSDKVDLVPRDFLPGHTVGVLRTGNATLGDIICFEVAYDDLVRDTVRAGADLLVVQTNNATFGYTDESVQQLAMSRLRAVETGRAVVHISTVGVSALIEPDGRIVARSGHFDTAVLSATLPLRTQETVATRIGPLPEIVLAVLGVVLTLGAACVRRIRAPRRALSDGPPSSAIPTEPEAKEPRP